MADEQIPQVVTQTPIFKGRVFAVKQEVVQFPDGRTMTFDLVEHPGSFGIVALPSPDRIVLVRQYRYPAGAYMWEIPAGTAEPAEMPLDGAKRELTEETGYRCGRIHEIGSTFYPSPGYCNERMQLFLAEDLTPGEQSPDEDEDIEVWIFPVTEVRTMIERGEIQDAKTIIALSLLAAR